MWATQCQPGQQDGMTVVVLVVLALQAAMLEAGPSGCGDQGDLVAGTEVITLTIYYKEL